MCFKALENQQGVHILWGHYYEKKPELNPAFKVLFSLKIWANSKNHTRKPEKGELKFIQMTFSWDSKCESSSVHKNRTLKKSSFLFEITKGVCLFVYSFISIEQKQIQETDPKALTVIYVKVCPACDFLQEFCSVQSYMQVFYPFVCGARECC